MAVMIAAPLPAAAAQQPGGCFAGSDPRTRVVVKVRAPVRAFLCLCFSVLDPPCPLNLGRIGGSSFA
jgi:hypothetical protein